MLAIVSPSQPTRIRSLQFNHPVGQIRKSHRWRNAFNLHELMQKWWILYWFRIVMIDCCPWNIGLQSGMWRSQRHQGPEEHRCQKSEGLLIWMRWLLPQDKIWPRSKAGLVQRLLGQSVRQYQNYLLLRAGFSRFPDTIGRWRSSLFHFQKWPDHGY